ncbi:MAG: hypothetical protein AAGH99_03390 [Planctomycetota bacterium]
MMFPSHTQSLVLGFGPWWSSAISSGLGVKCAVIAGVGVVVFAVAVRAGWRLRPSTRSESSALQRLRGEGGTATIEFLLVLFSALVVSLLLLQTVLVFSGNLFVHYAAFAATRSAIVNIPDGQPGGGGSITKPNGENGEEEDSAFSRAERSAAFALAPVSGRLAATAGDPDAFEAGLESFYRAYGQEPPAWVGNLAAERLAYALEHTDIDLYETGVTESGDVGLNLAEENSGEATTLTFGPKDPVTLGVRYRLHLSVPWASRVFADGTHLTALGDTPYADVSATSTMTLEGHDVNLPPPPEVTRE